MSHPTRRPVPSRLPADATPFVGRVTELAQLTTLLTRSRLVSVTGTGGVGKTRLALRAARKAAPQFANGVRLAELSALTDPELLFHTIAAALGLPELDARRRRDTVLEYLRQGETLLVLDTCEHLIDACADLAEAILRETARVTLLTTSRQPLDVAGENVFPLSPLPVPGPGEPVVPGDAADFFARRATAVVSGFAVTPDNREDVTVLCGKLDGIPLAIELASVQLRTLPLRELATRMPLLPGGEHGTGRRHATLRSAIAWSYNLCAPAEQALWQRLSVFAGPCTIGAIEEVCSDRDLPREQVIAAIIGLVDKSVLLRADPAMAGEPTRYRLLDTIREYGAERLAESGQQAAARARLLRHYLTRARRFRDDFVGDEQLTLLREMRLDHANVRAALEFALGADQGSFGEEGLYAEGAGLVTALCGYWDASSLHHEGTRWLDRVLEVLGGPSPERTAALAVRCLLGATSASLPQAISDGEEAVRLADETGDQANGAQARMHLTHALTVAGRHEDATRTGAEAMRQLAALGDRAGMTIQAARMAYSCQAAGDLGKADEWYRRGLELLGAAPDERCVTGWLHTIGAFTFLMRGRHDDCAAACREALAAQYELGNTTGIGIQLETFARLAVPEGRHARAAWLYGAADPLWQRAGAVLSNNPKLLRMHQDHSKLAREALGARRFDALFARGAGYPLSEVVALAIADADDLPARPPYGALTRREQEVAVLAADGMPNREIAECMAIAKRTVDAHVGHIYAKLGVSSRAELALWLRQRS